MFVVSPPHPGIYLGSRNTRPSGIVLCCLTAMALVPSSSLPARFWEHVWVTVTQCLTSSLRQLCPGEGTVERMPLCTLLQLHPAQSASSSGSSVCAVPAVSAMPGAGSLPGMREARRAAGTECLTASLAYLPQTKLSLTSALCLDCGILQSNRL